MPLYDFKCPDGCGYFHDIFVPLSQQDKTTCPECKAVLTTIIRAVMTIGPMPSKPLVLDQVGRRFESVTEYRDYKRENADWDFLSPKSKAWQDHKDMAREKAEACAKRGGYIDLEDKRTRRKKDNAKKAGKLDKKIYVH
jgi:putative FmdB family regulatory protein